MVAFAAQAQLVKRRKASKTRYTADLEAGTAQLASWVVVDNNTVRIVSGMGACVAIATSLEEKSINCGF